MQAKAAVQPLVEIMQSEATDNKHRDLRNWWVHMHRDQNLIS